MSSLNQSVNDGEPKTPTSLWFTAEIQLMMHGFGDCSKPLLESATLVEDIVLHHMIKILYQVEDICRQRNARFIGIEDFLFLYRQDKCRLRRLVRYLEFKDLRAVAVKNSGLDEDDDIDNRTMKRRQKICQEFLNCIDQTGELISMLEDMGEDEMKTQRKLRLELLTRNMDAQQYLDFCEARQASFTPRYKLQKFKDWLLSCVTLDIKPNQYALEILSFLAYETVAEIVDLALMTKKDRKINSDDLMSFTMAPSCANYDQFAIPKADRASANNLNTPTTNLLSPTGPLIGGPAMNSVSSMVNNQSNGLANRLKKVNQPDIGQSVDLITSNAITPAEIREAVRRLCLQRGPFADFVKTTQLSVGRQLLIS